MKSARTNLSLGIPWVPNWKLAVKKVKICECGVGGYAMSKVQVWFSSRLKLSVCVNSSTRDCTRKPCSNKGT